ncbi:hypothetical protein ACWC9T_22180 [Kitasatospora sp. NPDC001159]
MNITTSQAVAVNTAAGPTPAAPASLEATQVPAVLHLFHPLWHAATGGAVSLPALRRPRARRVYEM